MTRVVILMGLRGKSSFSTLPQLIKTGAHCRNQFISITPCTLNSLEIHFPFEKLVMVQGAQFTFILQLKCFFSG